MTAEMEGSIYKRGNRYWIKYYLDGRPIRLSPGRTKKETIKKLKLKLAEKARGEFIDPAHERLTVNELLDDYLRHSRLEGKKSVDKTERHAAAGSSPTRSFTETGGRFGTSAPLGGRRARRTA